MDKSNKIAFYLHSCLKHIFHACTQTATRSMHYITVKKRRLTLEFEFVFTSKVIFLFFI